MNITDAIDIMESISGVTDESTPVGDAWNVILRYIHNPTPPLAPPTDEELLAMRSWSSHSHTFDSDLVDFARAVLERWGR